MECTPGELDTLRLAAQEREADEWLRPSWLSCQITQSVSHAIAASLGGSKQKPPNMYERLGWAGPSASGKMTGKQIGSFLKGLKDRFKRG